MNKIIDFLPQFLSRKTHNIGVWSLDSRYFSDSQPILYAISTCLIKNIKITDILIYFRIGQRFNKNFSLIIKTYSVRFITNANTRNNNMSFSTYTAKLLYASAWSNGFPKISPSHITIVSAAINIVSSSDAEIKEKSSFCLREKQVLLPDSDHPGNFHQPKGSLLQIHIQDLWVIPFCGRHGSKNQFEWIFHII